VWNGLKRYLLLLHQLVHHRAAPLCHLPKLQAASFLLPADGCILRSIVLMQLRPHSEWQRLQPFQRRALPPC
jgi:hypothetical protein